MASRSGWTLLLLSVGLAPDRGHFFSSNARAKRRLHGPNLRKDCGVNKHLLADAAQTTAGTCLGPLVNFMVGS